MRAGWLLAALLCALPALAHPPAAKPLSPAARAALAKAKRTGAPGDLLAAKKVLAKEGRYACCIGKGGCDECVQEGGCGCGAALADGKGVCASCVAGWKAGDGKFEGIDPKSVKYAPMESMLGMLGDWPMNREASGTAWLPDASPMFGRMGQLGPWSAMLSAGGFVVATDQGGRRGERALFVPATVMGMAWRRTDSDRTVVGGRLMVSPDALSTGKRGYPQLFQASEGLVDRQHPHDLIGEFSAAATRRIAPGRFATLYAAVVGEPALGPAAYVHRPSARDNYEAPLSHHLFDATHVSFGVVTAALATRSVKFDASAFNGREPDENRYDIDPLRLDSYSGRVTVNPSAHLSVQASHGYLKSPEALEAGISQRRTTVSASYSGAGVDALLGWARTTKSGDGERHGIQALLLEGNASVTGGSVFGRVERADRDELSVPGRFAVTKATLGAVRTVPSPLPGMSAGLGASVSVYGVPSGLRAAYGSAPLSISVFLRLRSAAP